MHCLNILDPVIMLIFLQRSKNFEILLHISDIVIYKRSSFTKDFIFFLHTNITKTNNRHSNEIEEPTKLIIDNVNRTLFEYDIWFIK